jgi:apolipoprotein N-acyltransferase
VKSSSKAPAQGGATPYGRKVRSAIPGLFSGVVAAVPFIAEPLAPLAWVSAVPFLLLLTSTAQPLWFCYAAGFAFVATGLFWLWRLAAAFWLAAALVLGPFFLALAVVPTMRRRAPGLPLWTYVPLLWTSVESLKSSLTAYETTWFSFGYTQARRLPLVQLAEWTGATGVTLLLVLANAALADLILAFRPPSGSTSRRWAIAGAALAVTLPALANVLGTARIRQVRESLHDGPHVLLVQGNLSAEEKLSAEAAPEILDHQVRLTRDGLRPGVDLVAWSETMPLAPERGVEERETLRDVQRSLGLPLVTGGYGVVRDRDVLLPANSAFLVSPQGELRARYDKQVLVPFGEYIPLLGRYEWFRRSVGPRIERRTGFYPFMRPGRRATLFPVEYHGRTAKVAPLICYEDLLPSLLNRFVRAGADFFLVLSNENFYHPREMEQHVHMAVFRAIETRRAMLRTTNTGATCAIDPTGRVTARLDPDAEGTLLVTVPLSGVTPAFLGAGRLFGCLCAAGALGIIIYALRRLRGAPS